MTATKSYTLIKKYLNKKNLAPICDEANKELSIIALLGDNETQVVLHVSCDDMFVEFSACLKQSANKKSRKKLMEYLMKINNKIKNGCFVINLKNGKVCFKASLNTFEREILSDDLILSALNSPRVMLNNYYKEILDVMSGGKCIESFYIEDADKSGYISNEENILGFDNVIYDDYYNHVNYKISDTTKGFVDVEIQLTDPYLEELYKMDEEGEFTIPVERKIGDDSSDIPEELFLLIRNVALIDLKRGILRDSDEHANLIDLADFESYLNAVANAIKDKIKKAPNGAKLK